MRGIPHPLLVLARTERARVGAIVEDALIAAQGAATRAARMLDPPATRREMRSLLRVLDLAETARALRVEFRVRGPRWPYHRRRPPLPAAATASE
jgi:hypothetical protein